MVLDIQLLQKYFEEGNFSSVLELVSSVNTVEAKCFQIKSLFGMGKLNDALEILNTCKSLFLINDYWKVIYDYLLAGAFWYIGELDKAMDICKNTLIQTQNLDNKIDHTPFESKIFLLGRITQMIGVIYDNKGDYNNALEYGLKALAILNANNDIPGIITSYHAIGYVYGVRGQFDKAMNYYSKGLRIAQNNNLEKNIEGLYDNISGVYENRNLFKEALEYALKAISIGEKIHDKTQTLAFAYTDAYECYFELGDIENAKIYLEKLRIFAENASPRIQEIYLFEKAIHLKNSKRTLQRAEGEKILREFISKPRARKGMVIGAYKNLLELLLLEYQSSHEEEVLFEFKKLVNQLKILAEEQNIFSTLINVLILEAKLEAIDGRYDHSVSNLEKALEIATINKMDEFIKIVQKERSNIEKEFKKMQKILEENQNIVNLFNTTDVQNYLKEALKLIK